MFRVFIDHFLHEVVIIILDVSKKVDDSSVPNWLFQIRYLLSRFEDQLKKGYEEYQGQEVENNEQ